MIETRPRGRPRIVENGVRWNVYLDSQTVEALRRTARTKRRSMSFIIRELVREHLSLNTQDNEHA